VPALSCGDFNLFESHAIMKFICIKYNLTQLYPNYPMRAKIDQYLDFHLTSMKFISAYTTDFFFGPKFMKRPMAPNKEQRLIEMNEGL
jgi:glutathione S-transferase